MIKRCRISDFVFFTQYIVFNFATNSILMFSESVNPMWMDETFIFIVLHYQIYRSLYLSLSTSILEETLLYVH